MTIPTELEIDLPSGKGAAKIFVKEAFCGPDIATSLHGIKQLAHPSALKTPSPKLSVRPLTYMSRTNLLSSLKGVLRATSLSIMDVIEVKVPLSVSRSNLRELTLYSSSFPGFTLLPTLIEELLAVS